MPHPAVRRVKLTVSRELGKPERSKESVRQSELHRRRVGEAPRTIRATRSLLDVLRGDAALAELPISRGSPSPLLPDHRPKSTSQPLVNSTVGAQPLDLHSVPLMDVDLATIGQLAEHCLPHIQLLSSARPSALLSGPASRRVLFHPCASRSLHIHHVVRRTRTLPAVDPARHTKSEASRQTLDGTLRKSDCFPQLEGKLQRILQLPESVLADGQTPAKVGPRIRSGR